MLAGLEAVGEAAIKREVARRKMGEGLPSVRSAIAQVRTKLQNPSPLYSHIAYDKKQAVIYKADELEQELFAAQRAEQNKALHEDITFDLARFEKLSKGLTAEALKVLSEPKPVEKEEGAEEAAPADVEMKAEVEKAEGDVEMEKAENVSEETAPEETAEAPMEVDECD